MAFSFGPHITRRQVICHLAIDRHQKVNHSVEMRILILLALLWAQATMAQETYVVPPERTRGGNVSAYISLVRDLNERSVPVEISAPACSSSCTFFLLADQVCVSARTIFEFHGPQQGFFSIMGLPMRNMPTVEGRRRIAVTNAVMAANYDDRWPGLGDWYLENAAQKFSFGVVKVRGSSLNKAFGVPLCVTQTRP